MCATLSYLFRNVMVCISDRDYKLSSEFGKYFDCLLNMLADIGDVVPRFQIYERLFQDHLRLTQALSNAYLDVIEFCTTVKNVFKKAQRKHGMTCHR